MELKMNKYVIVYMVIFLNLLGFKALASSIDPIINKKVKEISPEDKGSDNEGARRCGAKGK